jgi:hypothetical protein
VTVSHLLKGKSELSLRPGVYHKSVRLGVKPLETHEQEIFLQLNHCGNSPYITSSLTRRWVCLLWISLAFRQLYVSHLQHIIENSSICTIYKFSVSTDFTEQIMHILLILCYNGSLVIWMAWSLTTAKFKADIISVSGFALSYTGSQLHPRRFSLYRLCTDRRESTADNSYSFVFAGHCLAMARLFIKPLPHN